MWAIAQLGLTRKFRCTVSPMECTYLPTGQKIMFFGLDDPGKVKSIKVPFGYIGIDWFEELDQFDGPEQIRNVEQSTLRGGSFSFTFKSFNPPAMARNWANRYVLEKKPGQMVHHSTYLTAPPEWLGPRFIADMSIWVKWSAPVHRSLKIYSSGRLQTPRSGSSTGSQTAWTGAGILTPGHGTGCTMTPPDARSTCLTS